MHGFNFSDAWFLTTLLLLEKRAELREIVAAGDWLNHAIFTAGEIDRALSAFIPMGFVELDDEKRIWATDNARALRDKTFERAGAFGKVERIEAKLKKIPRQEPASATEFFSEEEVTRAYEEYVQGLRVR